MAFTFDATPAGLTANSYATRAQADDFLAGRLRVTAWTGATTQQQEQALAMATTQIDSFRYVDEDRPKVDRQALKFPRNRDRNDSNGNKEVPVEIRNAAAIQATALLATDAVDTELRASLQAQGVQSVKIGDVAETYSGGSTVRGGMIAQMDAQAFALISPHMDTASQVRRL